MVECRSFKPNVVGSNPTVPIPQKKKGESDNRAQPVRENLSGFFILIAYKNINCYNLQQIEIPAKIFGLCFTTHMYYQVDLIRESILDLPAI